VIKYWTYNRSIEIIARIAALCVRQTKRKLPHKAKNARRHTCCTLQAAFSMGCLKLSAIKQLQEDSALLVTTQAGICKEHTQEQ
jgi:hypothetical protein